MRVERSVSVRIHKSKPAPTAEARQAAYRELLDRASRIAEKVEEVPEAEIESAIDEATNFVRHTPE
jgi:hypothetical protein